jgi:hypothetical protein
VPGEQPLLEAHVEKPFPMKRELKGRVGLVDRTESIVEKPFPMNLSSHNWHLLLSSSLCLSVIASLPTFALFFIPEVQILEYLDSQTRSLNARTETFGEKRWKSYRNP